MVEQLISIGILIIFIGVIVLFAGFILSVIKSKQTKVEGGGILFIGPIPVLGYASRKEIFYVLLTVSVILILAFLLISKRL